MVLKKLVERLTRPVEELDRRDLAAFCEALGVTPLDEVELRRPVRVGGEVRSVRIVPRAGADALEISVHDGSGSATAVFLGRRKIGGVTPGRRIVLEGVLTNDGPRHVMYNPLYTLLAGH